MVQSITNLVKTVNLLALWGYNLNVSIFQDQRYTETVWNFDLHMTVEFQVKLQGPIFSLSTLLFSSNLCYLLNCKCRDAWLGRVQQLYEKPRARTALGETHVLFHIQVIFQHTYGYFKMLTLNWRTFKIQNFIFKVFF